MMHSIILVGDILLAGFTAIFCLVVHQRLSTPSVPVTPPNPAPGLALSCGVSLGVGVVLGVLGSLPIAGPGDATEATHELTRVSVAASVNVLKAGMQGQIVAARLIGVGAGLGEAIWAIVAFRGFGGLTEVIEAYEQAFCLVGVV